MQALCKILCWPFTDRSQPDVLDLVRGCSWANVHKCFTASQVGCLPFDLKLLANAGKDPSNWQMLKKDSYNQRLNLPVIKFGSGVSEYIICLSSLYVSYSRLCALSWKLLQPSTLSTAMERTWCSCTGAFGPWCRSGVWLCVIMFLISPSLILKREFGYVPALTAPCKTRSTSQSFPN